MVEKVGSGLLARCNLSPVPLFIVAGPLTSVEPYFPPIDADWLSLLRHLREISTDDHMEVPASQPSNGCRGAQLEAG